MFVLQPLEKEFTIFWNPHSILILFETISQPQLPSPNLPLFPPDNSKTPPQHLPSTFQASQTPSSTPCSPLRIATCSPPTAPTNDSTPRSSLCTSLPVMSTQFCSSRSSPLRIFLSLPIPPHEQPAPLVAGSTPLPSRPPLLTASHNIQPPPPPPPPPQH